MDTKGRFRRSLEAFRRELTRPLDEPRTPQQELAASTRPKIGLALGGGFARGMAHIGVLKAFEEAGIPIDFIAGTSVGAAIGAAYSSGVSAKELEEIACILKFSDFARFTISRYGLWNNDRMSRLLQRILKVKTFEELKIPLAVAATDFVTGDSVVFKQGPLVEAVRASCAYPGVFLPVNLNGRLLVDGLLAHPVPTTPLKEMGADRVVAVYFNSHWVGSTGPKHFMDVIGQCFSIAQARMCSLWQINADVVLEPEVSGFAYDAFHKSPELVKAGEESAKAHIEQIQSWLAAPVEAAPVTSAKRDRVMAPIASAPVS